MLEWLSLVPNLAALGMRYIYRPETNFRRYVKKSRALNRTATKLLMFDAVLIASGRDACVRVAVKISERKAIFQKAIQKPQTLYLEFVLVFWTT
jgi:hypothetical protein